MEINKMIGRSDSKLETVLTKKELQEYLNALPDDAVLVIKQDGYYGNEMKDYFGYEKDEQERYLLFHLESRP